MNNSIWNSLMNQAPMTVDKYYFDAMEFLDRANGEGYAKNNPELIAWLVMAMTLDFSVAATLTRMESWKKK